MSNPPTRLWSKHPRMIDERHSHLFEGLWFHSACLEPMPSSSKLTHRDNWETGEASQWKCRWLRARVTDSVLFWLSSSVYLENRTPAQQVHDSGLPTGLYLMLNGIPQQRGGHSFEMSHLPASNGGRWARGTTIFLSSLFWRNSCFPRQLVNFFLNLKKITSNKNGVKNLKVGALRLNKLCSFSI